MKIALNKIKNIVIGENNSISVEYDEETSTLIIDSNIIPTVIDNNFNELDSRLSNVEARINLRFQGELNALKSKIEKLENGKVS